MVLSNGRHAKTRAGLLAVACGLAAAGCGPVVPHAESSLEEATVTGRVLSSGKPITKGRVIFDPANINRSKVAARTAEIGPDGAYQITTLVGENRVTVAIPGWRPKAGAPYIQQIYDVRQGRENRLDIPLP
jgi:hypothetical protein